MPPSLTGNSSRHRRSARPRARYAADIGFGASRGSIGVVCGTPMQITSSRSSSLVALASTPRKRASAWATEGGPAKTAAADSSLGRRRSTSTAHGPGHEPEQPSEREVRDAVDGLTVVRVAVEDASERGGVQRERDSEQGDALGQSTFEPERETPACRARGLEQGVGARRTQRLRVGGREQRSRAAVEHGLGRGHRDDDVCLRERGVDPKRAIGVGDLDEILALGIVDLDPPVEAAREFRRDEELEVPVARAAAQSAGHEERLAVERRSGPVELGHRRCDRSAPRIAEGARDRERRRLDDDRRPRATRTRAPRAAGLRAESAARREPRLRRQRSARRAAEGPARLRLHRLRRGRASSRTPAAGGSKDRAVEAQERRAEATLRPEPGGVAGSSSASPSS